MQVGLHLSALQAIDTLARSIIESSKGNSSGAISLGSMASEQLSMLFAYERMAEFGRYEKLRIFLIFSISSIDQGGMVCTCMTGLLTTIALDESSWVYVCFFA